MICRAGLSRPPADGRAVIRAGSLLAGETALACGCSGRCRWRWLGAAGPGGRGSVPRAAGRPLAAALLNATLLAGVGAVTMTPETAIAVVLGLRALAVARLHGTQDARWWLAVGAFAGLALLSKYTAVLFGLGLAIWLLLAQRHWLGRWQAWAGGLLALLLFLPFIRWNAAHGWASFAKQGGRAGTGEAGFGLALRWIGELIGGQAGLATPLVFLLCLAGAAAAARRWRDPAALLLAALTLPGAVLFLWQATGSRVQGNWPAVLYPAAAIAAAALLGAPFWLRCGMPAWCWAGR